MHGNIIITTRNEQLSFYEKSYKVSRMSEEDAKALFVRRSRITNAEDSKLVTELVQVLSVRLYIVPIEVPDMHTGARPSCPRDCASRRVPSGQ